MKPWFKESPYDEEMLEVHDEYGGVTQISKYDTNGIDVLMGRAKPLTTEDYVRLRLLRKTKRKTRI